MLVHFDLDVFQYFVRLFGMQLFLEPVQCDPDYVPMMKPGSRGRTQFQPQAMHPIDVFGPQPGRMRAQVEKERLGGIGKDNFQRQ